MANFEEQLKDVKLLRGVELEQIGDIKQFKASAERLVVGIFMTLVFIPIIFIWTVKEEKILEM